MTKKIEAFWVDATAEDVARVMNGETVEARFRNTDIDSWAEMNLAGWSKQDPQDFSVWAGIGWSNHYRHCQVYREPDWYANKPDPGLGYRLLGKFPHEALKPGDEVWNLWDDKQWARSDNANGGGDQVFSIWYRRRIEAAEPTQQIDRRVSLQVGDRVRHPSGIFVIVTEKGFEVTQ